jgi:hypothetical protein
MELSERQLVLEGEMRFDQNTNHRYTPPLASLHAYKAMAFIEHGVPVQIAVDPKTLDWFYDKGCSPWTDGQCIVVCGVRAMSEWYVSSRRRLADRNNLPAMVGAGARWRTRNNMLIAFANRDKARAARQGYIMPSFGPLERMKDQVGDMLATAGDAS